MTGNCSRFPPVRLKGETRKSLWSVEINHIQGILQQVNIAKLVCGIGLQRLWWVGETQTLPSVSNSCNSVKMAPERIPARQNSCALNPLAASGVKPHSPQGMGMYLRWFLISFFSLRYFLCQLSSVPDFFLHASPRTGAASLASLPFPVQSWGISDLALAGWPGLSQSWWGAGPCAVADLVPCHHSLWKHTSPWAAAGRFSPCLTSR